MVKATQIKPHMAVLGSNNLQVATVDPIEGKNLKLTKTIAGITTTSRSTG